MPLLSRSFFRRRVISMATTLSVAATSYALAQGPSRMDRMHPAAAATDPTERQFLFDNQLAMSKMTSGMVTDPTGDVDRDFVAMMIPHHQGAIDMARAELKYGHNETLRRLAESIVDNQGQEISIMRHAIDGDSQDNISTSGKGAAALAH